MATKEDFINYIDSKLSPHFTREGVIWSCDKQVSMGNQIMVINGRRFEQPGATKNIKLCVELTGEGCLKEPNEDIPFIQVKFYVIEDDETRYLCPETCLYYDDNIYFDNLIKEFFGF